MLRPSTARRGVKQWIASRRDQVTENQSQVILWVMTGLRKLKRDERPEVFNVIRRALEKVEREMKEEQNPSDPPYRETDSSWMLNVPSGEKPASSSGN
jgi:hypothetical protein